MMKMNRIVVAIGIVALSFTVSGQSARIELVPSFENIGVSIRFSDTIESIEGVAMSIRTLESQDRFRNIHPLSKIEEGRFAGSAFALEADTEYELRFQSASFPEDEYRTVRTRSDEFPRAEGRTYHVSVSSGSDSNSGLNAAAPFRSLGQALTLARSGTRILLQSGTYYEGDFEVFRSGTETAPIVVESAAGADVILDGTDPIFEPEWQRFDTPARVYRTPTTVQPDNIYVDGEHLFRHATLEDLRTQRWFMPGFYADGAFLYVRLPEGESPSDHRVTIPRFTTGMTFVRQSYWQIKGVTFQHYGLGPFHRGIYLDQSDHILIENCRFRQNVVGVGIKRGADFNTIQDCFFEDKPMATWDWNAVKSGVAGYEGGGVYVYGSSEQNEGNVIRRNRFSDLFDGVHLYSADPSGPTVNMDFYGNVITDCLDDAIETDGGGINGRIYSNLLDGFLTGISVAPAALGPTYIFRNVLRQWRSAAEFDGYPFKFNSNSSFDTRFVFLYHNTCHTDIPGQNGFLFKRYSRWSDIVSRNNIYSGTNYALESQSSSNPVDFDYDNIMSSHSSRFARWRGASHGDLSSFAMATGQEQHGVSVDPLFISATSSDYHLNPESLLIDRGQLVPGINDDFSGAAPDIGAYEFVGSGQASIERISVSGNDLVLRFIGLANQRYQIRSTSDLTLPVEWADVSSGVSAGSDGRFEFRQTLRPGTRFYHALAVE